ncbi:FAD-dependent monooxygenase [Sphingomonas sp.]|uniref:FAD-dependent monooxygenase n=1 Tax=Sphingomonas sp. TaxID=28214 RepID=UPI0035BC8849
MGETKTYSETDVAIVGAGPSGLALAIELGSRGIGCVVIERNDRVGYAPRAKTTNVRTRTHLRRWGIADKLAAVSPFGVDYPSDVQFVTRLAGPRIALIPDAMNCAPARDDRYPEHGQWVPQYKLEQVLREHAEGLPPVGIRFSTEFVSAAQDDGGVSVTVRDADGEGRIRCRYLVGADGARSAVREGIGATLQGTYGLSRNYNVVFRAPGLAEAHGHGPGAMYWQVNATAPSLIGPMDAPDIWYFMPTRLPEGFKVTQDSAAALIREATGIDLPYEILSSDEWVASSFIADRYRDRRIFLAGDACHLHPPFGGYGMNMGLADGVDLGWKLAGVIGGWGGEALLDSYEVERRKIHEEVIAEAASNHAVLSNELLAEGLEEPGPAGDAVRAQVGERIVAAKRKEFHTLGTVLGGCYGESPIIAGEGGASPVPDSLHYHPTSRPGCLAPHLWRSYGASLYDMFGPGFTLLCRPDADSHDVREAIAEAADAPLAIVRLSAQEAGTLYPARLTLVRPDQYVAWRGDSWQPGVLGLATGRGASAGADRTSYHADAAA